MHKTLFLPSGSLNTLIIREGEWHTWGTQESHKNCVVVKLPVLHMSLMMPPPGDTHATQERRQSGIPSTVAATFLS